ncbi:baseplate J/gp47 family protein [Streptomyces sp. NPDC016845]|uniref:baseplate J/gp47 family protein n=1 Tax=Streptomyces sp. NPDC016845 TaxID=3364972 RepID=UPI0037B4FC1B
MTADDLPLDDAHPATDRRRVAALRDYLRRLAPALTPGWTPSGGRDDFGTALLEIAARLAEQTTRRLDRTAERDVLAFFDFLGLAPAPPRAATGMLVLALAANHPRAVFAEARTQISAGNDITFETVHGLRVVPGQIDTLLTLDPATDRIEPGPALVATAQPSPIRPQDYSLVTFAAEHSTTVQLSPAAGLATGDLLRIGGQIHRIATTDGNGLVILDDPLPAAAAAGTTASRADALESFTLRDRQRHAFYLGHTELLKLEQPATVTVRLAPGSLARRLAGLDLTWAVFGTAENQTDPAWHDLDLIGADAGELALAKSWPGTVDETEVAGRRSRWLRASLTGAVTDATSASRLSLGVASATAPPSAEPEQVSRSITRAAHNGTPLSTTRRFYPFGPEPLRFDEFALAAPEALSKRGARATLAITLADASLTSFDITTGTPDDSGYGAGRNGYLHLLHRDPVGTFHWQRLSTVGDGRQLLLGGPPAGVGLAGRNVDLVVVRDRLGGLWAARVQRPTAVAPAAVDTSGWQKLPTLNGAAPRPVVVPSQPGAVLLDIAQDRLHALAVDDLGRAVGGWHALDAAPDFTGNWRLAPVQDNGWPRTPPDAGLEVTAIDSGGGLWLGLSPAHAPLDLAWTNLGGSGAAAAHDVHPAATRYSVDGQTRLWVAYAARYGEELRLHGLSHDGAVCEHHPTEILLRAGSGLHSNPAAPLGIGGQPITAGLSPDRAEALLWLGADRSVPVPLADVDVTGNPLLLGDGRTTELIIPGSGERLMRTPIKVPLADYTLHDSITLDRERVAHHAELTAIPDDPAASVMARLTCRIKEADVRVYQVDRPLAAQMTVRLLRLARPTAPPFTGGFADTDDRTRLRLDAEDTGTTRKGQRLIIGNTSYRVIEVLAGRVARLSAGVTGNDAAPPYSPAVQLQQREITGADLRTLVELDTGPRGGLPTTLDFGAPVVPHAPTIRSRQSRGNTVWAQLGNGWGTAPPRQGRVVVLGTPGQPAWTVDAFARGYENPELSWEFFDGHGWRVLDDGFVDHTQHLSTSGDIEFVVPGELRTTEIGGRQDHWIRARLIGGDYGRPKYVVQETLLDKNTRTQTVTTDTTDLHPPEILAVEAAFVLSDRIPPETVLVENNLDVRDETAAAATAAARFDLFQGSSALTDGRALFAGLTAAPGVGPVTLFADADDQDGDTALLADLRTPDSWRSLPVDDRTRALRRRGLITITFDADPAPAHLFGQDRVWLRLRPAGTATTWAPVVHRLLLNATGITHARTMPNEIVGSSPGEPALTLRLAEPHVLPDSVELRIREELSDEELTQLRQRRARQQPGQQQDGEPLVSTDPERFPGSWVRWQRVDTLTGHHGDARVYLLDPATGQLRFGDGRTGRIPPAGRDNIRCFRYRQGGGPEGNLDAWSPARLISAVEGVETVALPVDTAGGFSVPAAGSLLATAPHRLRHAGRALTSADVEAVAVSSSSDIVRARCTPPARPGDPVRVAIAVRGRDRCPSPTLAQRDAVAAAVRDAGWGGLTEASLRVTGPAWARTFVTARLTAPRDRLAEVQQNARQALLTFLDAINGGPTGEGWPFGRRPNRGDLLRTLTAVPGLDRVREVTVTPAGPLPPAALICTEAAAITVVVTATEGPP